MNHASIAPADRATPLCPHFGLCGGCQLQHLTYAAQLALKANQLQSLLAPLNLKLPELQLHPSPPLAYRNRIRLTLAEIDGQLRAGYLGASHEEDQPNSPGPGTHFLPITECPIAAPILWNTAEVLLKLLNQRSALWIERAPFTFDQLELFTTADESHLQISLFARTSAKSLPARFVNELAALCESLRLEVPALDGAGMYLIPPRAARSRRVEHPRIGPAWGSPGLKYTIHAPQNQPPTDYWVPRGAFFQANRYLLPELLSLVTSNRAGTLAWDLYAGVGLFTRALAPHFGRITSVEAAEPAFTALASGRLPNRRAVKDTALDFLSTSVLQRDRPGLIVLDPPRTGAGPEVCGLLARIAAPTLIYVSCSPQTLPTDLKVLTASGYRIAELHLVDLFPQTTHIETVAVLTH
jgi:23S rRNA (uracil1939-C5)-methyltransferase